MFLARIDLSRKISSNNIEVGQSVAIFPQNSESDVINCVKAFDWSPDELLGNKTVKELLTEQIDITTQKVNLDKLFDVARNPGARDFVKAIKQKYDDHVTLLELSEEFLEAKPDFEVPLFSLEEQSMIPKIKPRFYSIVNDPFESSERANSLKFIFSETKFMKLGRTKRGLCTRFLSDPDVIGNQKI